MWPEDSDAVRIVWTQAGDNQGLCLFRSCSASECCPAGTVCENVGSLGTVCNFPDDPMSANIACTGGGDAGADGGAVVDSGVIIDSGVVADVPNG